VNVTSRNINREFLRIRQIEHPNVSVKAQVVEAKPITELKWRRGGLLKDHQDFIAQMRPT